MTDARGVTATYSHDALNRVTQVRYSKDGTEQTIDYQYDQGDYALGRLTQVNDGVSSVGWQYNVHGRVTSRTETLNGSGLTRQIAYDGTGKPQTITTPGGHQIGYVHDTLGHINQISIDGAAALTDIAWQPLGPVSGWKFHNQPYARQYDTAGRITAVTLGGKARSLAWDAANRITLSADYPVSNPTTPDNGHAYGYDNLDRLTTTVDANSNQGYSYDLNGNRASLTVGANNYTYAVDPASNRLNSTQGPGSPRNYVYDAAGNPTTDGRNSYNYDLLGRVESVTSAGVTTAYGYNGFGERISKGVRNGSTVTLQSRYFYDDAGHLVGEYAGDNTPVQETVWLGNIPVLVLMPGNKVYAIDTDHLDTPRVIKDETGKVVWQWDNADAFGDNPPNDDPDGDGVKFIYNLRFPGQVYDQESGLNYNYYRYYDAGTGGYTQSDPIGLAGGQFSTYGYVDGNPLNGIDSLGLLNGFPSAGDVGSQLGGVAGNNYSRPSSCECRTQIRMPDYLQFQIDVYVFSVSATFTRYGDIFTGKAVNRPYPTPNTLGVSISDGWMIYCGEPGRDKLNNYLDGWASGGGGYVLIGGAYSMNPSGSAINVGVGVGGASASPGSVNKYQGNIYREPWK